MDATDRLAEVRKNSGQTQAEFAENLDISRRTFINYESGDREFPVSFVRKLFAKFSINPNWLIGGFGPKTPENRQQNILDAVEVAEVFIAAKKLKLTPKRKANLILHLINYFDEGGSADNVVAKQILESYHE